MSLDFICNSFSYKCFTCSRWTIKENAFMGFYTQKLEYLWFLYRKFNDFSNRFNNIVYSPYIRKSHFWNIPQIGNFVFFIRTFFIFANQRYRYSTITTIYFRLNFYGFSFNKRTINFIFIYHFPIIVIVDIYIFRQFV